jgi:hypothetical protein
MRIRARRTLVLTFFLVALCAGAIWAAAALTSKPHFDKGALPKAEAAGETVACDADVAPDKLIVVPDMGSFKMAGVGDAPPIVSVIGKPFLARDGRKTVPLRIIANGGHSFADGIGETRFWLDATRPLPSYIQEKVKGTELPAVQEMRFHFFFAMEARPGKLYRTINPSIMRSDNVVAFPPPPGTIYRLMEPINLEDVTEPGVVAARVVSNRVVIPQSRLAPDTDTRREM